MDISKHIGKANEASRKKNYDFAISLFREILEIKPDQADARKGLRDAELKKYAKKYPPFILRFLQGFPCLLKVFLYQKLKKYEKVMASCEGYLCYDPKSRRINASLARAALQLGFEDTAILAFETLVDAYPDDVRTLNSLGRLYYRKGELQQALTFYEKSLEIDPRNQDAMRARKNLAAEGALIETGFQTAASSSELLKDKEKHQELLREDRIVKTEKDASKIEEELKQKLKENPDDEKILLKMARLLSERERYEEAISFLETILQKDEENYEIKTFYGDLRLRILNRDLARAEQDAAEDEIRVLREKRLAFETEEYKWRVEEHPTDLPLRFNLGRALYQGNRTDEAIAEFQKSLKDPRLQVDSLIMLGNSFLKKGMAELAASQFRKALEELSGTSRKAMEVRYTLGNIYESMGNIDKAEGEFARIYEVDITFRDISQKMETISQRKKEKKD